MRAVLSRTSSLLEALQYLAPGASKRSLRRMLDQGRVSLNGKICGDPRQMVQAGNVLEIGARTRSPKALPGLKVLFDDEDLLVVQKSAGLLSVSTTHEHDRTAYARLCQYISRESPKNRLFIVHRLDKFVSGILVFAKSEKVKARLQAAFEKHDIERKYWAIVEGSVAKDRGSIRSYLAEDRHYRMHSTEDRMVGKHAVTHYRVLRRFAKFTALEIALETGRKNQIRVHLSELGHPIVGDRTYGSKINPLGRMGLHAFCLGFVHPVTGTKLHFATEPPPEFRRFIPTQSV
ncbi:MAG: pseudouridine synthase [Acidobacteria bacterium]|nr:pseudouridine synthase [Acidobacteriota bacterium]